MCLDCFENGHFVSDNLLGHLVPSILLKVNRSSLHLRNDYPPIHLTSLLKVRAEVHNGSQKDCERHCNPELFFDAAFKVLHSDKVVIVFV